MKADEVCLWCFSPKVIMTGLCRPCYTRKINRGILDRLETDFRPLTENNRFIFDAYLKSLRARVVTDADVPLARRFAKYLSDNGVAQLKSWTDVFAVSKELKFYYNHNPNRGCPIKEVGRWLEQSGVIAPLTEEKTLDRSRCFKRLDLATKPIARAYFEEVSKKHPSIFGLTAVVLIAKWEKFIAKPFSEATDEDAAQFVATVPEESLVRRGHFIRNMTWFYDWLVLKGHVETNPFAAIPQPFVKRRCPKCSKMRVFRYQGSLCHICMTDRWARPKLKPLEVQSNELREYQRHLFGLFLRHVRRRSLDDGYIQDARIFLNFLKTEDSVPILRSWSDVESLSKTLAASINGKEAISRGCPVVKVGQILQELSVLPVREEAYNWGVEKQFESLSSALLAPVQAYVDYLRRGCRSERTVVAIVRGIKRFHDWLKANSGVDPLSASEKMANDYLASVEGQEQIRYTRQMLKRFYAWMKLERYILANPFEKIPAVRLRPSLKVCAQEHVRQVEAFIRRADSNPSSAMILALVFYWGVTTKQLAQATVEFENGRIKIIFHRGLLTFGNSRHRRDQVLVLPSGPAWFKALQKRFAESWRQNHKPTPDLPRQPLIPSPSGRHNRPLNTLAVRRIYYRAILAATTIKIPLNVLRRSGADAHAKRSSAAILPRMGWSKTHAFNFTWMPRQLYSEQKINEDNKDRAEG